MQKTNKSLGQHWLQDKNIISKIVESADIQKTDNVLEIGPGLGTLTSEILRKANNVVAVEFDKTLASKLPKQFPGNRLRVVCDDILNFDLGELPIGYKVVANVPYYITSKIVHKLLTATNRPSVISLLVQKEVANRIVAEPGRMSVLSISAQIYADVSLGVEVGAEYFTPPPKVDSQVVVLRLRDTPIVSKDLERTFFKLVKAGFSAKRKKLKSALSGGLNISKEEVLLLTDGVNIDPEKRAQDLSIEDWKSLAQVYKDNDVK